MRRGGTEGRREGREEVASPSSAFRRVLAPPPSGGGKTQLQVKDSVSRAGGPGWREPGTNGREVGNQAVWRASTAKATHGVQNVRDMRLDTFWQSDGVAPHTVTAQWPESVAIGEVALYLDYSTDENYTPADIRVELGLDGETLQEILCETVVVVNSGWAKFQLSPAVPARIMVVSILGTRRGGKDTRLRQIRVYTAQSSTLDPFSPFLSQSTEVIR